MFMRRNEVCTCSQNLSDNTDRSHEDNTNSRRCLLVLLPRVCINLVPNLVHLKRSQHDLHDSNNQKYSSLPTLVSDHSEAEQDHVRKWRNVTLTSSGYSMLNNLATIANHNHDSSQTHRKKTPYGRVLNSSCSPCSCAIRISRESYYINRRERLDVFGVKENEQKLREGNTKRSCQRYDGPQESRVAFSTPRGRTS